MCRLVLCGGGALLILGAGVVYDAAEQRRASAVEHAEPLDRMAPTGELAEAMGYRRDRSNVQEAVEANPLPAGPCGLAVLIGAVAIIAGVAVGRERPAAQRIGPAA